MRTTEKLTVSVQQPVAREARAVARRRRESLSALTDRALRDYLIRQAARTERATDDDWLDAVAETVEAMDR